MVTEKRPLQFFIYSRPAIERLEPHDAPHVIVSITTTVADTARLPPCDTCVGVLRLSFADATVPREDLPEEALFQPEQARLIWRFVLGARDRIERILVHCDAGMSRSPAVAAALSRILEGEDASFFRRYLPNSRVYRTMLEVYEAEFASES